MTITPNKWELDVQGYLNTCNITSATPRKQIRDFSAGVNDLGLWNSMVCWPLRSSQNYGSGDTAFSLGGLGTFNGTLVNGPTWGASGITLVASSIQRITASGVNGSHAEGASLFLAFAGSANMPSFPTMMSWQGTFSSNGQIQIARGAGTNTRGQTSTSGAGSFRDINSNVTASNFRQVITYGISGTAQDIASDDGAFINAPNITTLTTTGTFDRVVIGTRNSPFATAGISTDGVIAFACLAKAVNLLDFRTSLFSLYKQTLGQGLGLP